MNTAHTLTGSVKLSHIHSVVEHMSTPKRQFLAEFELYVMLAVVRLAPEAYGAAVRREIESRTGRSVSIGALYATLGRLEDKGLLEHRASHPLPVKGGRSRKFYEATPAGETALSHSAVALNRMMDGLGLAADGEVI